MKKIIPALLVGALLTLSGCSATDNGTTDTTADGNANVSELKVGATAVPAGEIIQYLIDSGQAEEAGLDITIQEFSDYTTPNQALADGTNDANLFQHAPFLDQFVANTGDELVNVGEIYLPPLALYSKKYSDVSELPDGAKLAVPNDSTNENRALELIASAGLIEVAEGADTLDGITANPHNFEFKEIEAASLPAAVDDLDAAIVNDSFAYPAGLTVEEQIVTEGQDSKYFNILATRKELENDERVQKLYELLLSDQTQEWINENYEGRVIPVSVDK